MPSANPTVLMRGPYSASQTDWNNVAVREHLCRLAQVAEVTTSAVVITDLAGVIVWVNASFTRISGYSYEESVGRVPGRFLQGPDTDRVVTARIAEALQDRRGIAAELINYTKTGRRYWLGLKIEPLLDAAGKVEGFMAIQADITERHERNRAHELLTARFNMATHAAKIGMYEFSANFKELWWSSVMWEIFGQDPDSFRPSPASWLQLIHPDDLERVRANNGTSGHGRPSPILSYRTVWPDGTVKYIESIAATHEDEGLSGALFDVTERVEAEEREHKLQQQLRESSRLAGMAEIATGVLHNVGNVLNSLGIATTTASRELKTIRIDRLEQAVATIRGHRESLAVFLTEDERGKFLPDYLLALSAQMAANMKTVQAEIDTTKHLLDHLRDIVGAQQAFARLGGTEEPVDLKDLAESALLVQAANLAQIEVVREFGDVPPLITDRHKMLQVLVNLISNASDAIRASDTQTGMIRIRIMREDDDALMVVEDTGVGMGAETLSRLWQYGFTTKQEGHGFGLHNSANAAHELGAALSAHSEGLGLGSRFTLRLPIVRHEPMLTGAAA